MSSPAPTGAARPVRLLLVEDDDLMRRSFAVALERYGYEVAVAADGLTGLEMFRDGAFDLLILDVLLPGLDGIGLCRRVPCSVARRSGSGGRVAPGHAAREPARLPRLVLA